MATFNASKDHFIIIQEGCVPPTTYFVSLDNCLENMLLRGFGDVTHWKLVPFMFILLLHPLESKLYVWFILHLEGSESPELMHRLMQDYCEVLWDSSWAGINLSNFSLYEIHQFFIPTMRYHMIIFYPWIWFSFSITSLILLLKKFCFYIVKS